MSKKVWLITGAGRGMGTDISKAALAAGNAVVATGRDPEQVAAAIGAHNDLLAVKLDVTSSDDAKAAVQAAVDKFGRVDVLGRVLRILGSVWGKPLLCIPVMT
jgi:NAD(P)-dependent dehydrogenase (short-subunit alcohol dehydrogenase family)